MQKVKGEGNVKRKWDHETTEQDISLCCVALCVCVCAKINFAFAYRRRSSITRCGGQSFGLGDLWDCTPFWNWTGSGSFGCLWWEVAWSFSLSLPSQCISDSPWLEQPEVLLLLQTVINILLPPRIISTSRSKNFVLESSPAHCSTPGDAGKDLRREGLAESTSQAAYLGEWWLLLTTEKRQR